MPPQPPAPEPPRYHASTRPAGGLSPGTVTARLVLMPPALWAKVEALLQREGFRPY